MERFKNLLISNNFIAGLRVFLELMNEFQILLKHLGVFKTRKNSHKLEAKITIIVHAIEKGLSLSTPRVGFGELKMKELLYLLFDYEARYGNRFFIKQAFPVIEAYFDFNSKNGYTNHQLFGLYEKLKLKIGSIDTTNSGGTIDIFKKDIESRSKIDFKDFVCSRYSIRDFSNDPVDQDLILNAIEIAKKTPSACNRQAWKVFVFRDKIKKKELLDWQGNRGFTENIDTAIVVTCSLNAFFIHERHQAYIDGALYAMTLIYALHSQGLGTIPLTMSMMTSQMNVFHEKFGINKDLVPILIIGVGSLKNQYKVAISERKDIEEYVEFI